MPSSPSLRHYMTLAPKTVNYDQTLEDAADYMRTLHVRHLPVMKGGKLIGIVSARDIHLIQKFNQKRKTRATVEDALTPNPIFAGPNTKLSNLLPELSDPHFGCVLVVDKGILLGIFTATEALRAIADTFKNLFYSAS